jgi:hypothetical protein
LSFSLSRARGAGAAQLTPRRGALPQDHVDDAAMMAAQRAAFEAAFEAEVTSRCTLPHKI